MSRHTLNAKYQMLIEALDGTPRDLERLTRRVDDAAALMRPAAGAWCIKEVVVHLAEVEEQFRARFVRMVEQDEPYELSTHPGFGEHDLGRDLRELIALFAARRASTTAYLRALDHRQWLRTCVHEVHGRIKLRRQVEFLIGHDNEHLAQIVTIRECMERA
jgi:uncharacterized damage-inducible protein DinB